MSAFSKIENYKEYRSLLDRVSFRTFFHSPDWEDFLEKELPWLRFEHYMWRGELLMSIARAKMFGREKVVSHPFCEYGGPLPLVKRVNFEDFVSDFRQFFGERAKIKFHPYMNKKFGEQNYSPTDLSAVLAWFPDPSRGQNGPNLGASRWAGENDLGSNFAPQTQDLMTFWIEDYSKKLVDDLWRGLRKTLRREIKKAEKDGIYVEHCANENELSQFYAIYIKTVRRHRNIPFTFNIFKFLMKSPDADILLAKKNGKILGGGVFLFYAPFIHYFLSANDNKAAGANIGHSVLWAAVSGYKDNKEYDYFDLGGTRKGSSLEVFKRGWGAEEIPIHDIPTFYRMLECRDAQYKSKVRNILGLVPAPIMSRAAKYALWFKM